MKATLIYRVKSLLVSGAVVEMVIWRLPKPDSERPHGYKYRLYCGRGGQRIVSYDNERGKGDHHHIRGIEEPYRFETVDRLIEDFLADVARMEVEDAQGDN
ncbi:MAG: hypothetical protein KGL00_10505 [Gammaproteobacteria bacterium]|nr:hypothetical protein [Gammaproteobacteria bacterium]MDE2022924.1 hypothetical protein [Gammaproteobacteria bacterium]MDE2139460.1 hypothetical protein [Gammaproteobacteria bacterium]MDE2274612.1 hypothetical protein [Gammaproteobacteria bacterium]